MYIDTHVHLNSDLLYQDLSAVIKRAIANKVEKMIVVGYDRSMNQQAIKIAEAYPNIYAIVGYHPVGSEKLTEDDFNILESYLSHPKVVAIGECGLDFHWDKEHINEQKIAFTRQINLAKAYKLPLSIHMRDATLPMYELLKNHAPLKGIMHCYSGSAEMAHRFIELGLTISLGGPVTFLNAKVPKEVAKQVSLEHLVIETDAPYLAPHPYRGKQNEPSLLPIIAESIANIKGVNVEEVAKKTTTNAIKLFNLKESTQ